MATEPDRRLPDQQPPDPRPMGQLPSDRRLGQPEPTLPPEGSQVEAPLGEGGLGITLGLLGCCVFYLFAWAFPIPWVQRYFLGHPVAVATTLLFAIGVAILAIKVWRVNRAARITAQLRDDDLGPAVAEDASAADQWLLQQDARRAAARWLLALGELPLAARRSPLVMRLQELLGRQAMRVSTEPLADDQREVSAREADAAHDSLQLVRIIIWAIPMLGFLGTVIGITQTLGGLDFTDGTAAVDRLKAGLYVAFDTTALGLVLSVVAIFLQFPVERAQQRLLGEIDRRTGALLATHLPSTETAEHPAAHIAQLCEGIRVAVGQSLASQAELWRTTIDAAHAHWHQVAQDNGQRIGEALEKSLAPTLQSHGRTLAQHAQSLAEHAEALRGIRQDWNEDLQRRWELWNEAFSRGADMLTGQQAALAQQGETLTAQSLTLAQHSERLGQQTDVLLQSGERTEQLGQLQHSLDSNLARLAEVNAAVQHSLQIAAESQRTQSLDAQLSEAMLVLARAVDVLTHRLPPRQGLGDEGDAPGRVNEAGRIDRAVSSPTDSQFVQRRAA